MTHRGLLLTIALPLVAACAHANKSAAAAAPAPEPAVATAPQPAAPAPPACTADDQCSAKELCVSGRCVPITPELAECRASAHFDFDRSDVRRVDQPMLQRMARCLNALPQETTLVEGNCDERGTVQYNIALGFRRAHAVAAYMEDLGVSSGTLSEVSYGKELPACTDATESCWAMNRRADVERGAKAKDVAARVRTDERRESAKASAATAKTSTGTHRTHGRTPPREQPAATPPATAPAR